MIATTFTKADIQDGLSLLLIVDNPIALLAILECLAEVSPELRQAIWETLPQQKYSELQQWAIELLVDSNIVDGELFPNGLNPTQRIFKAFGKLPQDLKRTVWASIPQSKREELRAIA